MEILSQISNKTRGKSWDLPVEQADSKDATITIPNDDKTGETFYMILEVVNECEMPLKAYQ